MPRWTATIRGRLEFEREITVYACNEEDATIVAEELLMRSIHPNDECDVSEMYIEKQVDDKDTQFEILLRKKE